jgi:serine/threonine-protein kinase RsbW
MRVETSVDARLDNLAAIRAFIEEACANAGAPPSACFDLKLAVDEACSNIIEHGYAGRAGGSIAIACEKTEDGVRVTIVDQGKGFNPAAVSAPDLSAGWEDRAVGGLGWHLIRRSVDEVDYGPNPGGGNRLTLVKRSPGR